MSSEAPDFSKLDLAKKVVVGLYLFSAAVYFSWRINTFNEQAWAFSALIFGAECFGLFTVCLHLFMTSRLTERKSLPPLDGASIDVFIPTINEPVEIVRRTVLAAVNMSLPHETWLLDDGDRPEIAAIAANLGAHYIARRDASHAKAGNLNHALLKSRGEFIAVFDCDHAPGKNFLARTIGYFRDPKVAFVQTPQDFYNLDSFQHRANGKGRTVWNEQSIFFRVIQRGKDYWNAAFFCGSCAMIRRASLESIGGFATGTVTEDLHTSLKLHKKGYKSVYHAEPLAFGIAPATIQPFLRQRVRWGQGAMQVWRSEGILFSKGLTLPQRLNYLASVITYFDGWQKGIFYFAPVIVLLTGIMPIEADGTAFLIRFVPYFLLSFLLFEELARGYGRSVLIEQYNMARFMALAWSTLFFFRRKLRFRVTAKNRSARMNRVVNLLPQFMVLGLNGIAIPIGIVLFYATGHLPQDGLIANIAWSVVNALIAFGVLRFAMRAFQFRRNDYRFPLPLVAVLDDENAAAPVHVTVDDVSSSGCRLYGRFAPPAEEGAIVSGKLVLPCGALPFKARITVLSRGGVGEHSYVKAIGCTFLWSSTARKDVLELFLYGSDLQWILQDIQDRIETPTECMIRLFHSGERPNADAYRWSAFLYQDGDRQDMQVGMMSLPAHGEAQRLVLFGRPATTTLTGRQLSRTEHEAVRYDIGDLTQIESGVGPVFIGVVTKTEAAPSGALEPAIATEIFKLAANG